MTLMLGSLHSLLRSSSPRKASLSALLKYIRIARKGILKRF